MKSRAEINRENYLRSKTKRQDAARQRMRDLRQGWRAAIAEWDGENAPSDAAIEASGLGEWSVVAAFREPIDLLIEQEESCA